MNNEQILMCVVALILGMLLAHMLKSVCGCKVVEGQNCLTCVGGQPADNGVCPSPSIPSCSGTYEYFRHDLLSQGTGPCTPRSSLLRRYKCDGDGDHYYKDRGVATCCMAVPGTEPELYMPTTCQIPDSDGEAR